MKKIICIFMSVLLILSLNCVNVLAVEEDNVSQLSKYNIIKGDPDGKMRLADNLTRAEAVTLLVRLYGFTPETSEAVPPNEFSDMEKHWAQNAAMIAKGLRIVEAGENTMFNPNANITAEEFIKMIVCLLGYQEVAERKGGNPHGYIIQAAKLGVTKEISVDSGNCITRENAVQIICNSLDIPIMVMTSFNLNGANTYTILNGKNGVEFRSLRTMIEEK
ncbi:MAG: S-layer homology domain-containing protein [Clostridia bacterium]|nr:S-layer homology domain-containing protein [Clostridia bacterium]